MDFPDDEIEADVKRMIKSHAVAWKLEATLAWLEVRIDEYKALERRRPRDR